MVTTTNEFGYNDRSEVIAAAMGLTNNFDYVFDSIGNRLSATNNSETTQYQANSLNQYTNISDGLTNSPTYDADGNTLTNGDWTYAWNGENRLISASNGATVVTMTYDFRGRRFSKVVDGDEKKYIYNGYNVIRETSSSATNHYTWGLDLRQSIQRAGGVGGLLSVTESDGETYFSAADANGNVMGYIDDAGSVKAVYTFDAFGRIIASSGAKKDDFKFRFSTKYQDSTGLYYYGYRYYDAEFGRWLNRDPIAEWGGINLYHFLFNNPINWFDGLGLEAFTGPTSMLFDYLVCVLDGLTDFVEGLSQDDIDKLTERYIGDAKYPDFGEDWTQIVKPAVDYFKENYSDIDDWTVKDLSDIDAEGYNPLGPDIQIEEDLIEGALGGEVDAIENLIHEPQHDWNQRGTAHGEGWLGLGEKWDEKMRRALNQATSLAKDADKWDTIKCQCESDKLYAQ